MKTSVKVPIVKEVPVPDLKHPEPKYDMLPRHEVKRFTNIVHNGVYRYVFIILKQFSSKRSREDDHNY